MDDRQRPLTVEENFDHLGLAEWAEATLSPEQRQKLHEAVDDEGSPQNVSQARYLFELSQLAKPRDQELTRLLSERALVAAENEACWMEGERNGLSSKYWGYEAFLEGLSDLRFGSEDDRRRFYDVAEKQVEIGAEHSERLQQMEVGPGWHHQHAGYFYLIEKEAEEGNAERAAALLTKAEAEGWSGGWDYLRRTYQIG